MIGARQESSKAKCMGLLCAPNEFLGQRKPGSSHICGRGDAMIRMRDISRNACMACICRASACPALPGARLIGVAPRATRHKPDARARSIRMTMSDEIPVCLRSGAMADIRRQRPDMRWHVRRQPPGRQWNRGPFKRRHRMSRGASSTRWKRPTRTLRTTRQPARHGTRTNRPCRGCGSGLCALSVPAVLSRSTASTSMCGMCCMACRAFLRGCR